MKIPAGKKIIFYENDGKSYLSGIDFDNNPLLLEEDFQLNLSSEFQSLLEGDAGKVGSIFSSVTRKLFNYNISGAFKEMGFQIWTGTNPVGLNVEASIRYKTKRLLRCLVAYKKNNWTSITY